MISKVREFIENVNIYLQIHEIELNILKMLGRVYEFFF